MWQFIIIGYKERWFRLKYNLLFYFKINGYGQVDLHQVNKINVLNNYFFVTLFVHNSHIKFNISI